jgi:hypothetical protein
MSRLGTEHVTTMSGCERVEIRNDMLSVSPRRRGAAAIALGIVLGLALLLVAVLPAGVALASSSESAQVATDYATARKSSDIEAMLALFADNAVIIDRLGYSHAGRDEIRQVLQISTSRGRGLAVMDQRVSGEHVFWVERAATPMLTLATTVEAVVEGGRITRLVYRTDEEVQTRLPSVGDSIPAPLGMVVSLLLAGLSLTVLCLATRPARAAQPRPGLLGGLQRWSQARRAGWNTFAVWTNRRRP